MATSKKPAKTTTPAVTPANDVASISAALVNSFQTKMATSDAPEKKVVSRPVFDGYLVLGLVSVPVKSYKATEIEKVSFNTIHICNAKEHGEAIANGGDPVAPVYTQLKESGYYCPTCSPDASVRVPSTDQLKGFKHGDNQFVTISDDERKSCLVKSNKKLEIAEFVKLTDVDPIYFEASEYIVPGEDFKEVFAALRQEMVNKGVVGIVKAAQRGREQVAVLRPFGKSGMSIHYLYLEHEVRDCDKWINATVESNTANLTGMLIDAMTSDEFDLSQYQDSYTRALNKMVSTKVGGGVVELPKKEADPVADNPNDIMAKLAASLAAPAITAKKAKKKLAVA